MIAVRSRLGTRAAMLCSACITVIGCSVDASLEGKRCPCLDGYDCDPATSTCVAGGAVRDPSKLLAVTDFQAAWTTPNQMYWTWNSSGTKEDFARYEIWIARSEAALVAGEVTRFGPEKNPELGRFTLPRTQQAEDFVRSTLTDGFTPDTSYAARLFAIDRVGDAAQSEVALATTTLLPVADVPLFEDGPPNWIQPPCVETSSGAPHSGSAHLEYTVSCSAANAACEPSTAPACWSAPIVGFTAAFTALTPGKFADAFIELAVALDSSSHIYWGTALLGVPIGGSFSIQPITYRADGQYRVYQIALRALGDGTRLMNVDDLKTTGIDSFRFGGELPAGSIQRVDSVKIRW